jgi:hypothetical protein
MESANLSSLVCGDISLSRYPTVSKEPMAEDRAPPIQARPVMPDDEALDRLLYNLGAELND